jgi:hypothetical protein
MFFTDSEATPGITSPQMGKPGLYNNGKRRRLISVYDMMVLYVTNYTVQSRSWETDSRSTG